MSQYLKFIFNRIGVQQINKAIVIEFDQQWANRQIADEFKEVFPNADVSAKKCVEEIDIDLIIIPYMDDFVQEKPGGISLYTFLQSSPIPWAMLYQLRYRAIDVMPAQKVLSYLKQCQRVSFYIRLLNRFPLLNLVSRLFLRRTF